MVQWTAGREAWKTSDKSEPRRQRGKRRRQRQREEKRKTLISHLERGHAVRSRGARQTRQEGLSTVVEQGAEAEEGTQRGQGRPRAHRGREIIGTTTTRAEPTVSDEEGQTRPRGEGRAEGQAHKRTREKSARGSQRRRSFRRQRCARHSRQHSAHKAVRGRRGRRGAHTGARGRHGRA